MKKIFFIGAMSLLLLTVVLPTRNTLAATSPTTSPEPQFPADAAEPNDSEKTARVLGEIDSTHDKAQISFHTQRDVDYFKLQLKEGVSYRFFIEIPSDSLALPAMLLKHVSRNGYKTNAGNSTVGKYHDAQLLVTPREDGDYILYIFNKGKPGYYNFGISAGLNNSADQLPEPNGTLKTAAPLTITVPPDTGSTLLKQTYKSTFHIAKDIDTVIIDSNGFSGPCAIDVIGEEGTPIDIYSGVVYETDNLAGRKYGLTSKRKLSETNTVFILDNCRRYKKISLDIRPGSKVTTDTLFASGSYKELPYRIELVTGDSQESLLLTKERITPFKYGNFSLHTPDDTDMLWFPFVAGKSYTIETFQLETNTDTTIDKNFIVCKPLYVPIQPPVVPGSRTSRVRSYIGCDNKTTTQQSAATIDDGGTEPKASRLTLTAKEIARATHDGDTHIGITVMQSPKLKRKYYNDGTGYRVRILEDGKELKVGEINVSRVRVRVSPPAPER